MIIFEGAFVLSGIWREGGLLVETSFFERELLCKARVVSVYLFIYLTCFVCIVEPCLSCLVYPWDALMCLFDTWMGCGGGTGGKWVMLSEMTGLAGCGVSERRMS